MDLRLDDGSTIVELTRPTQGTRHRILFGVEQGSGREVTVKVELISGALAIETRALEWLGAHGGSAPRLRFSGRVSSGDEAGAACIVCDRVAGKPAATRPAWDRLGRALGRLGRVPWKGSGLAIEDHQSFLSAHETRLDDLGGALGSDLRGNLPAVPASYPPAPLVLTHGDPGPGNFLDDGTAGTLIDWEDAQVAPRGLDLGRAAFIALLGSGPEGYVAEDHTERARSVVTGLLAEADAWQPRADELAWWLSVAGVQFAHRRLERAGEPGVLPWRDALGVLDEAPADIGLTGRVPGRPATEGPGGFSPALLRSPPGVK
jgi:aminoglycoside phosphotransferase (APT) family kinase protein